MILLDSNVLIYAATASDPRRGACEAVLRKAFLPPHEYALTWINLFEFLRVVTHPRVLPLPMEFDRALENARDLADSVPILHPGPRHLDYVAQASRDLAPVRGDRVFDCRIAAILLENGGSRILSFDTHLRRVQGLKVFPPGES